ncbi:MAG: tRNA-intron lyase [Candidatus Woesearchaeota archaeon]|jgi:tRNA-intron endonuclease|nr:tRNA-intron lyase [Candidatus Woesearchaeota archaeon]
MNRRTRVDKKLGSFFVFDESRTQSLFSKGFGSKNGIVLELSSYEVLYLLEKEKIEVFSVGKVLGKDKILSRKESMINYYVFKDLRSRGYNVKSGLKYGFVFRVYDKGKKVGEDHAIWLIEPISESERFKISDLTGKNRVAHSTKKILLFAIVDDEGKVTYIETAWKRI